MEDYYGTDLIDEFNKLSYYVGFVNPYEKRTHIAWLIESEELLSNPVFERDKVVGICTDTTYLERRIALAILLNKLKMNTEMEKKVFVINREDLLNEDYLSMAAEELIDDEKLAYLIENAHINNKNTIAKIFGVDKKIVNIKINNYFNKEEDIKLKRVIND